MRFLLLRLADALGGATYVPLLWSAFHVVKASLSTWGGALSDRFGRKWMIIAGWTVYAIVYFGFAWSTSAAGFIAWFLFYGCTLRLLKERRRRSSRISRQPNAAARRFGWYNATTGIGALIASVLFGELYEHFGASVAFMTAPRLRRGGCVAALHSHRYNQRFRW
jgi:predicted MFS family arabinose efflux permease